jgi:hypothetical protein
MGQRIVVGVEPDANRSAVRRKLARLDAQIVREPAPELPDVFVVEIADHEDVNTFLTKVKAQPGVRYAEPDTWQSSF